MPRPIPSSPSERPSIRQIAEMLDVSAMTVSRALRNSPRVSGVLRTKIRKMADKLGYRPDPTVTKLMSHLRHRKKMKVTSVIAAISSLAEEVETHQSRKVWLKARERAKELGYHLEIFRVSETDHLDRQLERTLVSRGIEGVLLLQMQQPVAVDRLLDWDKFSVAITSPSVLSPDFPRVAANHFHNAKLLCAELTRRGRKRIGFVGSETYCVRTHDAFTAAAAWQSIVSGGAPLRPLVFSSYERVAKELPGWFKRERPDAIIVHFEDLLPLVRQTLGLGPGGSVLLACSSVSPKDAICPGIDERHDLIGSKAVDVLTSMINRSERNICTAYSSTLIDGQWFEPKVAGAKRSRRGSAVLQVAEGDGARIQ